MTAIVILVGLLVIGPLALLAGADSRDRAPRSQHPWWPTKRNCR